MEINIDIKDFPALPENPNWDEYRGYVIDREGQLYYLDAGLAQLFATGRIIMLPESPKDLANFYGPLTVVSVRVTFKADSESRKKK